MEGEKKWKKKMEEEEEDGRWNEKKTNGQSGLDDPKSACSYTSILLYELCSP